MFWKGEIFLAQHSTLVNIAIGSVFLSFLDIDKSEKPPGIIFGEKSMRYKVVT